MLWHSIILQTLQKSYFSAQFTILNPTKPRRETDSFHPQKKPWRETSFSLTFILKKNSNPNFIWPPKSKYSHGQCHCIGTYICISASLNHLKCVKEGHLKFMISSWLLFYNAVILPTKWCKIIVIRLYTTSSRHCRVFGSNFTILRISVFYNGVM